MFTSKRCLQVSTKVCCYLGILLLYMPNDLNWYWGNLVVYVNSYIYCYHPQSATKAPWLSALFLSSWGVSLMIGAYLRKKFKTLYVAALGVVLYDLGIFTSHLAVQQSMYLLYFTMGVMCGLGYGMIQSMVFIWIRNLTVANVGLAYGMVTNCLNLGAIGLNEFTTLYINPDNVDAKLDDGVSKLFAEKSVVDRVPPYFLALGVLVFAFHFTGIFLIRISGLTDESSDALVDKRMLTSSSETNESEQRPTLEKNAKRGHIKYGEERKIDNLPRCSCKESECLSVAENPKRISREISACSLCKDDESYDCTLKNAEKDHVVSESKKLESTASDSTNENEENSLTLRDALKMKTFYFLCLILLAADVCYLCVLNFYKTFGELWINDDYFLTEVGIASSVFVLVLRTAWSVFLDRQGVKCTSVLLIGFISIAFLSYYSVSAISKWLFAFWTMSFSSMCTALYVVFPVSAQKLFGRDNFADIYGAIMSTTIVTNLLAPTLLTVVLQSLGWFGLFTGLGLLTFAVLIVVILGLPSK